MIKIPKLDPKQMYFLPLGGSEQFGVNFNLYAFGGKWLAVDCGIGFADERHPGCDILLPDPTFIEERADDLVGLIVTHAHEDHVGAISYLWTRLRCPIYCTAFTASVLRRKLEENPECRDADITIIEPSETIKIAPFKATFVNVSHSIPDTVSVLIETKAGTVMHSGDWNLDPTPVLGAKTDSKMLKEAGKAGVLAYIGDSTNAEVAGRTGTELDVEKGLAALFKEIKGRIIVTIFASNVGRIRSIAKAAEACGRSVAIAGRSMHSMTASARDCGYLKDTKPFLKEEDIGDLPAGRQVLIVTGSQGEPRAQLARIARADNKNIRLGVGDTVIFSSRAIPGNERKINEVKNNLSSAGVKIITPYDTPHKVHISGHPCRDEITDMLGWIKPAAIIPVHGERTQLEAQAALAGSLGYKNILVPKNGSLIRLDPDELEVVAEIETGVLAVEERRVLKSGHAAVSERRKLQHAGVIHITLVLSERGDLVADPQISTAGLFDETDERDQEIKSEIVAEIEDILADMERQDRTDDHVVHEEIRIGIRRFLFSALRLKPTTTVHVVRV